MLRYHEEECPYCNIPMQERKMNTDSVRVWICLECGHEKRLDYRGL